MQRRRMLLLLRSLLGLLRRYGRLISLPAIDGDHDEAIQRPHTEQIAAQIPGAGLLILPDTSHFSFLQDPDQFTWHVRHFLGRV